MKTVMYACLLALLCQEGCRPGNREKEENGKYVVTAPLRMDTALTKEYVAQIRSVRDIEIRALEKGFLENTYVDEGQQVKAGQLLFRIMPKVYEAELQKAKAEVKTAEIELENTRALVEKKVVSANEQALAQAKLDEAKAELALAELHLSFTEIKAPFDGTIDRLPKKTGSLIDEGELLTTLSDNSQVFAYFNVSEPEYLNYRENAKERGNDEVRLQLADNRLLPVSGKVETIESEFDNETGNIAFRARFANADGLLKNGETGKIRMTRPLKNALLIPQKATYEVQDKIYVFVVDAQHVVRSRNITISGRLPDLYIVESGLSENDRILLEGVQKVKDEDRISYDYRQPGEVLGHLKVKAE